jgi:hypothetical protein
MAESSQAPLKNNPDTLLGQSHEFEAAAEESVHEFYGIMRSNSPMRDEIRAMDLR